MKKRKNEWIDAILKSPAEVVDKAGLEERGGPICRFLKRRMRLSPNQRLATEHLTNYGDPDE